MKVLLFGSRFWTDKDYIREVIGPQGYAPDTVFIHGDNGYDRTGRMLFNRPDAEAVRGADKLAGAVAEEMGFQVQRFPADWRKHGRRAGPLRNAEMAAARPDEAICFHEDIDNSRGSNGMRDLLIRAGIHVMVFDRSPDPMLKWLEENP